MFGLLLKIRLLAARNVARETWQRHPALAAGLALLSLALFGGLYLGFLTLFRYTGGAVYTRELVYQIFYFLMLFLLAGAVPFVASTLLQSHDYTLLFASPVSPRAVIAAKLLDAAVTNSLQFAILGIPAIVACASALGLPLLGWLLVPLVIALFILLPALLTAFALLIALLLLGLPRLRAAITLLNILMAAVVCITIVIETNRLPLHFGDLNTALTTLRPVVTPTPRAAYFAPSHWFADALTQISLQTPHGLAMALLRLAEVGLIVGGLYVACVLLGARLLTAGAVADAQEGGAIRPENDTAKAGWGRWFTPPIAGMIAKDMKYLRRDNVLMSQIGMPLILFCVPFLMIFQSAEFRINETLFYFASVLVGIIVFMQTSILSLSSIGLESRSFWVVLTSPNTLRAMLWAKFWLSLFVSAGTGVLLTLFAGLFFGAPIWVVAAQSGLVICSCAALCALGVGISAAFPRFVYDNPAHRVSAWALILGFFATVAYVIVTGLIFGVTWLVSSFERQNAPSPLIYGMGALVYLAITLYAVFVPMAAGTRRMERYEWEH